MRFNQALCLYLNREFSQLIHQVYKLPLGQTEKKVPLWKESLRLNKVTIIYMAITVIIPVTMSTFASFIIYEQANTLTSFGTLELIFLTICLATLMGTALIPTTFVALANGYLFGWKGLFIVLIAYVLASTIGYFIGKKIGRNRTKNWIEGNLKLKALSTQVHKNEKLLIFLGRLSPVLPFAMMNVFFSAIGTSFKNFITIGSIGMMPRTILFIWTGTQAKSLQILFNRGEQPSAINYITFGLIIITSFALIIVIKKILKKASVLN